MADELSSKSGILNTFFVNLILLRSTMLFYFSRAPFMLEHCLIDDICLPVFKNIYILLIILLCLFIYLCIYFLYFLKFILSIFSRTTLETSVLLCALMCLSLVNIMYMLILLFA